MWSTPCSTSAGSAAPPGGAASVLSGRSRHTDHPSPTAPAANPGGSSEAPRRDLASQGPLAAWRFRAWTSGWATDKVGARFLGGATRGRELNPETSGQWRVNTPLHKASLRSLRNPPVGVRCCSKMAVVTGFLVQTCSQLLTSVSVLRLRVWLREISVWEARPMTFMWC